MIFHFIFVVLILNSNLFPVFYKIKRQLLPVITKNYDISTPSKNTQKTPLQIKHLNPIRLFGKKISGQDDFLSSLLKTSRYHHLKTAWVISKNTNDPPHLKSGKSDSISNASKPINPVDHIKILENFTQKKTPLEIHNTALNLLKTEQKEIGFLLLKRNLYQNFFLPSYFILANSELPVFWTPFLWHISLIILVCIALFFLFLSFKSPTNLFQLKLFFIYLILSFVWFFSEPLLLKKRVSSFQKMDLRLAPYSESSVYTEINPPEDLIVIRQQEDWLLVKSQEEKQTGWVKKQKVFQIF